MLFTALLAAQLSVGRVVFLQQNSDAEGMKLQVVAQLVAVLL
jgi:hypothetical protein